jgi:type I restriction-modification system DNA methylase subunit
VSVAVDDDWRSEFGIVSDESKGFFASPSDLNTPGVDASQSHAVRRAFELLALDGVLCSETAPLVYFKRVEHIETAEVARLHRAFWNHGGAAVLVLVAPEQVHIYSSLSQPLPPNARSGSPILRLVESLDRASSALREFLPSVQTGEYFRLHQPSFDPAHRVDKVLLDNLQATREALLSKSAGASADVLDALLCRLVFVCYLFDREVIGQTYLDAIGLPRAQHLRDVLSLEPRTRAKKYLYNLFRKLGEDFNGDLFSDDIDVEAQLVSPEAIDTLDRFFHATNVVTGQGAFWPYDFAAIPVEVISAIYERFLKGSEKQQGAFYTPRFLAELVLDVALAEAPTLLDRRYFDPACGSGIFLVGLFNRMAEEWRRANPTSGNDRRARELRDVLCSSLYGVDINPTACRITAFSLYLAYLAQLTPRDIQELQRNGHKLPRLVHYSGNSADGAIEGNIRCGDFFVDDPEYPVDADLVIGNPPWGSTALAGTPAALWCAHSDPPYPVPDEQIAAAFVWKALHHVAERGKVCLILPHSTLFNTTALDFQRILFNRHAVDRVLNLADYQRFLFGAAEHPAIVLTYRNTAPEGRQHAIEYWSPKVDWLATRADVIAIVPEDRQTLKAGDVSDDLEGTDAPQIWKQRYWATVRDQRLIDRLSLYPRLRDHVRGKGDRATDKPWLISEGFQPVTNDEDRATARTIQLPSRLFVQATSSNLALFLLREDCQKLPAAEVLVRARSNKRTEIFSAPHVLVASGFTRIAFTDFDVSFQDSLRGISGPSEDRNLLIFLAAYLRSPLAKYFLFHTSSSWGISRQVVYVEELVRLPFPLPDAMPNAARAWGCINEVAQIVTSAAARASDGVADRKGLVRDADAAARDLIDEYFDVLPTEKLLIDDTVRIIVPSTRPSRNRQGVPTITPSSVEQWDTYTRRLCDTLNGWAKSGTFIVQGSATASTNIGIGIVVLQKTRRGEPASGPPGDLGDLLVALERLRRVTSQRISTVEIIRGIKVFDGDRLYLVKPIGQRFWTQTAALNDADEIAGTILMHAPVGSA